AIYPLSLCVPELLLIRGDLGLFFGRRTRAEDPEPAISCFASRSISRLIGLLMLNHMLNPC
ncbi:MAG: hypothetical protein ACRCXH_09310, partial [Shewanella sp.]